MYYEHQDWEPVVLRKEHTASSFRQHKAEHKKIKNLDSDNPDAPKTLGVSAGKQIQQARCAKKLSQKELAQMMNVKPAIIQKYEQGKVIPNRAVLNKLNRILGIRIGN